jgi:pimeloyl-ACP methyl ester carboxylesterase
MPFFRRDGLEFHFRSEGDGLPFIFQHGLGGDLDQPFGLFDPPAGIRLIAFDCRAHGETYPLGEADKIGFIFFADDLLALLDHLALNRAIVGGISMGAGVALNFALRYPDRLLGLILSRPAWLAGPMEAPAISCFALIAELIRRHGATDGAAYFKRSDLYLDLLRRSPDSASSLVGQFDSPRAEETVVKLERMPNDAPSLLASRQDPIHPFGYGQTLAREIPRAEFLEITAKSVNLEQHGRDVQTFIEVFLHSQLMV